MAPHTVPHSMGDTPANGILPAVAKAAARLVADGTEERADPIVAFGAGAAASGDADPLRLGNKGARLVEMARLGLPVPPGFTIAAEAGKTVAGDSLSGALPGALIARIDAALTALEQRSAARFGDETRPLLLSVRSGAPVSMPGMMDSILNIGLNDRTVEGLAAASGDARFAYDCYRRLIQCFADVVMGVPAHRFESLLDEHKEARGLRRDADLTAEDWRILLPAYRAAVEAGCGRPFPQDPREQLRAAVAAVFRSWMNPRAVSFRMLHGIAGDIGTAVTVQAMVFGNRGAESGTGVLFTRDPSTGEPGLCGEFLADAQGEDVVSGTHDPDPLTVARAGDPERAMERRMPAAFAALSALAHRLEHAFGDMQDVEFTIESGRLYILQSRSGKRSPEASVRIAVDLAEEGIIDRAEAVRRVDPQALDELLRPTLAPGQIDGALAVGLPASPGAVTGRAVFTTEDALRLSRGGVPVVLCRPETSPKDIVGMQAAAGIVTARGGFTSHAATVARGMGRPCVCGARSLRIDPERQELRCGDVVVRTGDLLTIDGGTGAVVLGAAPLVRPQPAGAVARLLDWARETGAEPGAQAGASA